MDEVTVSAPCRDSAQGAIYQRIRRLEQQIIGLRALAEMTERLYGSEIGITPEADEALWSLVISAK